MNKLQTAIYELNAMEHAGHCDSILHRVDVRAKLTVTILFLIAVLSVPLADISKLILFFIYPIIGCAMAGISYGGILKRSLWVLPFIVFIGIFNPIIDRTVAFSVGGIAVTQGWVSFFSIILRGLVTVQAIFLLIITTGFYNMCHGLQHMGVPSVFTTQLLFVYRYLFVLLQEALAMHQARMSRSFGRTSYSIKMWSIFVGQLLLRTVARAERIHKAMLARGFTGHMEVGHLSPPGWSEFAYIAIWTIIFAVLRFTNPIDFMLSFNR